MTFAVSTSTLIIIIYKNKLLHQAARWAWRGWVCWVGVGVAGGRAAGLSHVVGLQQLLDGQAVAAPIVVHEQAVRH